jgi:hypothetical protein
VAVQAHLVDPVAEDFGDEVMPVGEREGTVRLGELARRFMRARCRRATQLAGDAPGRQQRDPAVELSVDLEGMRVSVGEAMHPVALPSAPRESFLDGTWDATGLLLDRFEDVEAVAARLPYVGGNWR